MKNNIKILSNAVVNRIAAGEVSDRPSSVVRELVENSLDAKSSHIHINFVDGGKKTIQVIDNGNGNAKEENN